MYAEDLQQLSLFMKYLVPKLFGHVSALTDAIHAELMEKTKLRGILNEGAARELDVVYAKVIDELGLPSGSRNLFRSQSSQIDWSIEREKRVSDIDLISGLLRWVMQESPQDYWTRSASVARVAACLKASGYAIGQTVVWDGVGERPRAPGSRNLILVVGGSWQTDSLADENFQPPSSVLTLYYQPQSIGSLFNTALYNLFDTIPEVYQTDFEDINEDIKRRLELSEAFVKAAQPSEEPNTYEDYIVSANFQWTNLGSESRCSAIARRLAAIYFPSMAEFVAPCYMRIASATNVKKVSQNIKSRGRIDSFPEQLARFRAVTAMIIISIAGRLAPETFAAVRHATVLDLSLDTWIAHLSKIINDAFSSSLSLSAAVRILAAVHTGHGPGSSPEEEDHDLLVGWRQGVFAIMPSLVMHMNMNQKAFGLECIEMFWANVKVREAGSIRSAQTRFIPIDVHTKGDDAQLLKGLCNASRSHGLALPSIACLTYLSILVLVRHCTTPNQIFASLDV